MKIKEILINLDVMIPEPRCELNYNQDYELLIATVLSAQCTDARVNQVTKVLFKKYDIWSLANADLVDYKTGLMIGIGSIIGVYFGVKVGHRANKQIQKKLALALYIIMFILMIKNIVF